MVWLTPLGNTVISCFRWTLASCRLVFLLRIAQMWQYWCWVQSVNEWQKCCGSNFGCWLMKKQCYHLGTTVMQLSHEFGKNFACCEWLIFSLKTREKFQELCCYGSGEFAGKQYFTQRRGIIVEFPWYWLVQSSPVTDWYFTMRLEIVLEFLLLLWDPGLHRTALINGFWK